MTSTLDNVINDVYSNIVGRSPCSAFRASLGLTHVSICGEERQNTLEWMV